VRPYPHTLEGYKAADARWKELWTKKYQNCDPQGNGGLTHDELLEWDAITLFRDNLFLETAGQMRAACSLEIGDLVEATLSDGMIYAQIGSRFNGHVYIIRSLTGGGGMSIKPWNVRKLSAIEVFTLGFAAE
jgi:hypothetical protein